MPTNIPSITPVTTPMHRSAVLTPADQDVFVASRETYDDTITGSHTTELNATIGAMNTVAGEVNGYATSASDSAGIATTKATLSSDYADKVALEVEAGTYSAKEHAVGDLTVTGGSAKAWAVDTSSPDGTSLKSAKSYSEDANTSATAAYNAQLAAEAIFDAMDDRYLGAKATAPTVDNDGNPLLAGAEYLDTSTTPNILYIWDGGLLQWAARNYIPTDHGSLSGLADDDHPQYHNDSRGDARYYTKTEVDLLLGDVVASPIITTSAPTGVSSSTMTLNGSVDSFGMTDMDALTVGFEYKRSVDGTWTTTAQVAKNTLGAFSTTISGLSTLTNYDIRAVAYDTLNPTLVSYGTTITQSTTSNDIPSNPTNAGSFPATLAKSYTTNYTFSGATDTDGTVTHYLVEQISSANLTVTTAEVAAGSAHAFTVANISVDEAVSFVVKAKDNAGAYSAGVTVNTTLKAIVYSIGTAGAMDFGVAPSPDAWAVLGLSEMSGTNDIGTDNRGNYQHTNGSIMVHIPKFYYRIGHASAPQYATYGLNSVEIAGADVYADEAAANAAGFALHRAFIDGGAVKNGFFIDKYLNSKKVGDTNVAVSVKNGNPIGLTTNTTYTPSSTMTGCTGILADAVVLSRARGAYFNTASVFMYGALAMLSLAHAQRATSTASCAWYDPSRTTNFPKGCNNGSRADINDTSVTWSASSDDASKGLTGSASTFAKSTHNGQNSGIADLNGLMWEPALGMTQIGTSATSTTQVTTNVLYLLKSSVALKNLTAGWDGATDAWGNTTNLSTRYDAITSPITISAAASEYWGSGSNQVLDPALSGVGRDLCGVLPKNDAADDATGTNQFGNDYIYHYNLHNMFPLFGGNWSASASAGVFSRALPYYRSGAGSLAGFRVAAYV